MRRPSALNALDEEMVAVIDSALQRWIGENKVDLVVLDFSCLPRAVSSGTDLLLLSQQSNWDVRRTKAFFASQYRLIDRLVHYPKPVISLIDGKLMGSAVGLAMAAHHRISTPTASLSFPETGVGLVPDNGSTWFLSRLRNRLGIWLAMTGEALAGEDIYREGLASHFADTDALPDLKAALVREGIGALPRRTGPDADVRHPHWTEIDICFSEDRVSNIVRLLREGSDWARMQAGLIEQKSPLALHIVLRQLRTGAILSDPRGALRLEYRLLSRLVCTPNFREGVKTFLSHGQRKPAWSPQHIARVSSGLVASFFAPPREGELAL
ncbi:enoyl-CoA hydratase/isomerase family protein [Henriciella aquimarina]|uniref:enoyl-CoA hydratase/isomerase family protein n=1 Tax=Henriciella aquimarina TaxID=545261 RepID=UPI001301FAC6|nr:enoyl-CoA hydratase/isomerase family protein [Henriciella aquimarina]